MNKSQLAEAVAREARLSKIDAVKALNAFVKVAVEALRGDEKILLTGTSDPLRMSQTKTARYAANFPSGL